MYYTTEYWKSVEGRNYKEAFRSNACYTAQEQQLAELVRTLNLTSVFEVGCGFGRMTKVLLDNCPTIRQYVALDISPEQLAYARELVTDSRVTFVEGCIEEVVIDQTFDLVLSVEVLMHIPPDKLQSVMQKLSGWSHKHVINIDYDPTLSWHNWHHPYQHMYQEHLGVTAVRTNIVNLQTMFHAEVK